MKERHVTYMEVSAQPSNIELIQIGNYNIEKVSEFKYLGSLVNSNNNLNIEIKHRLRAADKCYFGLRKHFRSHNINIKTKCRLYKTLIRPVLLYGSETWATTKNDENKIKIFERKILRRIYGPIKMETYSESYIMMNYTSYLEKQTQ